MSCQICGQPSHGKHFGALTCRACAAFFRRGATLKLEECTRNCKIWHNGRFYCKKCRLQRCFEVGMDSKKFQHDRDLISTSNNFVPSVKKSIPVSLATFLGRPSFILCCEPQNFSIEKTIIDVTFLIDKGYRVLKLRPKDHDNLSQLQKLSNKLMSSKSAVAPNVQLIEKMSKSGTIIFWENAFLQIGRVLSYLDDIQNMQPELRMTLLTSIWHIWGRIENLFRTAKGRKISIASDKLMLSNYQIIDVNTFDIDSSWSSAYTTDKLRYFLNGSGGWQVEEVIEKIIELNPTDIETTFMISQICFQYVGKRHQGEMEDITDRLQENLSNDLHTYYMDSVIARYSPRLAKLLAINNDIQRIIWEHRKRLELSATFDIFTVEFSHYDMFKDAFY